MWRSQRTFLSALNQLHPSRISHRRVHKGPSKLQTLTTEIMSGNNPTEMSVQQQQQQNEAKQAQHEQPQQPDYSTWTTTSLVERISELERQLHTRTSEYTSPPSPTTNAPQPLEDKAKAGEQEPIPKWLATGKFDPNDITHAPGARMPKPRRRMDPANYNFRHIALKFAYLGQNYNGLEHANRNVTPLPTIEEAMWKALRKTRLIFPTDMPEEDVADIFDNTVRRGSKPFEMSWEGCEYSKAGRTDRGVSAFGQVMGIKVRSARPKRRNPETVPGAGGAERTTDEAVTLEVAADENWDDIADELPYISLLNKTLPEDIRVLAWCPNPPEGFDARFSCRGRHYKYFFTQPAFSPTPGLLGFHPQRSNEPVKYREGWLDIDAMREAAKYFEGRHDFRNFCKVDTSKQIENFERVIYRAEIDLLDPKTNPLGYLNRPEFQALEQANADTTMAEAGTPTAPGSQVYVFNLEGTAFLWHQVRHMVAILFLVGQGLEPPTVVRDLLDISKNPRKPIYEMASDAPLVLWNCVFPPLDSDSREDALDWVYAGDYRQVKNQYAKAGGKFGLGGVIDDLWSLWRQRKVDEILAGALLDLAMEQGDQSVIGGANIQNLEREMQSKLQRVFVGGNEGKAGGKYIPLMQKKKIEAVEVLNARWLAAKKRKLEDSQAGNADA
ncbi:pseudouridine synthase [Aspergillus karnatakaensis]|uniref:pseudouridine synthase DEG1 n=1 Tax=Aspergillus karnatakaensis TaxID=1810916 RepID=UPI003CCDCEED